jgi:hypothetical protein
VLQNSHRESDLETYCEHGNKPSGYIEDEVFFFVLYE